MAVFRSASSTEPLRVSRSGQARADKLNSAAERCPKSLTGHAPHLQVLNRRRRRRKEEEELLEREREMQCV